VIKANVQNYKATQPNLDEQEKSWDEIQEKEDLNEKIDISDD